ncbi:MAG: trigger factor [Nitrospinota bacterium]|nr:trigger factor [Nitrospinota bacterium]
MKIEIEDLEPCKKKLTLVIPHDEYKQKANNYYQKLGQEVKVPGFRKGKIPLSMLEKRFGPEVKKEVLTQLVSDRIAKAIQEKGLHAVGAPSLIEMEAEEGTDITVSASVEVVPDFEIKSYTGIELDVKVAKVTDEEVNQVIETYRDRQAKTVSLTDRTVVQDKDLIKIDSKATVDGKPFKGGEAKDHLVQLGSKLLMEGMDEQLIGMNLNEEKDVVVDIPGELENKEIAGKKVTFQVTLKDIQKKKLPELNDEFARQANPNRNYESMDDMRQKIREELEGYEKKEGRKIAKKMLAHKITEINPIEIPPGLLQEQIKFMVKQARKKENPEAAHDHGQGEEHAHDHDVVVSEEDRKKYQDSARKVLQEELLMDRLATELNMNVDENEINAEINNFVRLLGGGDAKKMKKEWDKNGTLTRLHNRMRRDKTLESLLDKVTIKEEIVDRKEIITDN